METIYLADGLIKISFVDEQLKEIKLDQEIIADAFYFRPDASIENILKHLATQLTKASLELLEDYI